MSIADPNTIDLVATRPDTNVVRLVLTDHLTWADPDAHLLALQEKVNTYIAFVESGQLSQLKDPPIPPHPVVRIVVAAKYEPPANAREFFERTKSFLEGVGIEFDVEIRTDRPRSGNQ